MASVEGVGSGTTGGQYYTLKLEVKETSYSVSNNTSVVSWALYLTSRNNYSFSSWSFPVVVNVDGEVYNSSEYRSMSANSTITLASGTKTISHNSDGTKTISCSATVKATGAYYLPGNMSVSGTLKLTDIPRTSSVSCNSFNIGDATTIVISRASSSFTHTVTWAFGNASGTITTKTSATTIGATIPASSLYTQIPNAKSGTGTITCQTYSGNTLIGTSTCPFTAYVKEADCIPTVTATIVDTNDTTITLTGSNTKFIKGFSNVKVVISATAKNSATIKSYSTSTGDGKKSTTATTTFSNIGSNQVSVKATDSRGYSKSVSYTLSWINYVMLAFTKLEIKRPESTADQATMTVKGNYWNGNFGNKDNSLTLQYRYKVNGGTYSAWTSLTPTISGNTFSYTQLLENLDHNTEYVFQFMIDDELMTVYSNEGDGVLTKGIPIIRTSKDYVDIGGILKENGIEVETKETASVANYVGGTIDPNTTLYNLILTRHENNPSGGTEFYYIRTMFYQSKTTSSNRSQIAYGYSSNEIAYRYFYNEAWSKWSFVHEDTGWQEISVFLNGWQNYGESFASAAYTKSGNRVTLKGLVKSGTVPSVVFLLPEEYRPKETLIMSGMANSSTLAEIRIEKSGYVTINKGSSIWTSLDGLSFLVD